MNQHRVIPPTACARARLARDARFDGLFYTAVKSTGIFCRPICPANPPAEKNVEYYDSALAALRAGYRPCLRCRPESAPGSPAWRGVDATLGRALRLIDAGEWRDQSIEEFAARLGVSGRYLRRLFSDRLGVSPIRYLNYRRVLLAKQLLQETGMSVTAIALVSGFGSLRSFNAAFARVMGRAPREIRRAADNRSRSGGVTLFLSYRPPYNWEIMQQYFSARRIAGIEEVSMESYGRTFATPGLRGSFVAVHCPSRNGFRVELHLENQGPIGEVVAGIRRMLDLDADMGAISEVLGSCNAMARICRPGIRLPGAWSWFEAGVRAILGQQVSVKAATGLVTTLVEYCGQSLGGAGHIRKLFPTPGDLLESDLEFLRIPGSRRATLKTFAEFIAKNGDSPDADWQQIKGIGPWTRQYAAFRMGDPDILLAGDLGVRKGLARLGAPVDPEGWRPWRSYATMQLWHSLTD